MARDYDKLQAEHGFTDTQIAQLKAIDSYFAAMSAEAESTYRQRIREINEDCQRAISERVTRLFLGAAEARDDG